MPYWRLSSFYFFYFASLGALVPYWGKYLKDRGFDEQAIGELMAILMATKIIAPNIWGWIADHGLNRLTLVRWASVFSVIGFAGVFFSQQFWGIAAVMVMFSFFWNASLPQFEAITLNQLGTQVERYTLIRLWGSIGFIVVSMGFGALIDYHGTSTLPWGVLVLMLGIWLSSQWMPHTETPREHDHGGGLKHKLRQPEVLGLFMVCFLMQASHGPYYSLYTVYMNEYGYGDTLIGFLWALGVVTEVLVFLIMYRLVPRYGLRNILLASLLLAALRWWLIGMFAGSLAVQLFAQTLHAATFGTYHAVAIQLIHRFFTGRLQGRGQALYSSLSFGAGGAMGAFFSGYIWKHVSAESMFYSASVLCVLAYFIAFRYVLSR